MEHEKLQDSPEKAKLLLVDDNPLVLEVLENLFKSEDYEVITSDNGINALEALNDFQADAIVCDIMMPGMDGYTFQEKLRQSPRFASTPFIFLTALGQENDIQKGVQSGADAYLVKPFDPAELLSTVQGKIIRAKQIAQFYEDQKDIFTTQVLRSLSHEFRTPLVAVTTGSEFLLKEHENLPSEKVKALLSSIWKGGQRLEKLVNNFILVQQIQSGQSLKTFRRKAELVSANELFDGYFQKQKYLLEEDEFTLNYKNLLEEDVQIFVATNQIHAVLDRVITNCIKFTTNRKEIDVYVEQQDNKLVVTVRDYGMGFDIDSCTNITQAFHQHDRQRQEQQGSGLGLMIVKLLTRINKGRVNLTNAQDLEPGAVVNLTFLVNQKS